MTRGETIHKEFTQPPKDTFGTQIQKNKAVNIILHNSGLLKYDKEF